MIIILIWNFKIKEYVINHFFNANSSKILIMRYILHIVCNLYICPYIKIFKRVLHFKITLKKIVLYQKYDCVE